MMTDKDFIKEVFEIACGDGAICVENIDYGVNAREFTKEEVLEKLMEFSNNAYKWETGGEEWIQYYLLRY